MEELDKWKWKNQVNQHQPNSPHTHTLPWTPSGTNSRMSPGHSPGIPQTQDTSPSSTLQDTHPRQVLRTYHSGDTPRTPLPSPWTLLSDPRTHSHTLDTPPGQALWDTALDTPPEPPILDTFPGHSLRHPLRTHCTGQPLQDTPCTVTALGQGVRLTLSPALLWQLQSDGHAQQLPPETSKSTAGKGKEPGLSPAEGTGKVPSFTAITPRAHTSIL